MARLVLCVLALCALGASAYKIEKLADGVLLERQWDILSLFYHIREPLSYDRWDNLLKSWKLEENVSKFSNGTAVQIYVNMLKNNWHLPRAVPFALNNPEHIFEASNLFKILYSAKDYETFYKTAIYLRNIINEELYVYVLSVAVLYYPETQGIIPPPIYEILPSYFHNGEIMATAQRINTHGFRHIENIPSTYKWDNNVVIRWNETVWPYIDSNSPITYFTHDSGLNAYYYYFNLMYPFWLGSDIIPGIKQERRGELWLFIHRQLLARYYQERLSSHQGEIPDLGKVVEDGYTSGLLYPNGVPFPSRPDHFQLEKLEFQKYLDSALEYEQRLWRAVDQGFILNAKRERIDIDSDEAFDILGNLIQSNADSPNAEFYRDFLSIWKSLLGNSNVKGLRPYSNGRPSLVLPSILENYQTALRDPAFYILLKRVLGLLSEWQNRLPYYEEADLLLPSVVIEKVEVDKLVTYFEQTYMNLTSQLWLNDIEAKKLEDQVSVVVQHPRLNHKPFNVKIKVKSDVAKKVVVKLMLAPKYDSRGLKIPLNLNRENFVVIDEFIHDLAAGESVIVSDSTKNIWYGKDLRSALDMYIDTVVQKKWVPDMSAGINLFPARLMLPKGRVNGMDFILMAYIYEYKAPKVPFGTGFDPSVSLGLGSGARLSFDKPFGFPTNRRLYEFVVKNVSNLWIEDVLIYHKQTPEIQTPFAL